jgi:hypothetical protein
VDQPAEQPTAVLHVPGAFSAWFDTTAVAQGRDNANPACRAAHAAWKAAHVVRTGRGSYHRVEATGPVLEVFAEYGDVCLLVTADTPSSRERAAARKVRRRAAEALKELSAA